MQRMITGQILLILCCLSYLVWWYRGFRPGSDVNRIGGINGILLFVTALLGIAGLTCCLLSGVNGAAPAKLNPTLLGVAGIGVYILLLFITRYLLKRAVTMELLLIVGWSFLELAFANSLNAAGHLTDGSFFGICIVLAAVFAISLLLYVAYYRMEEMKAFYAAMVPLVLVAAAMGLLLFLIR